MKRRPPNLLTAMSLLLCVAAAVLWVRSYSGADQVGYGLWRSRMLPGLVDVLESRKWTRAELLPMLEGDPERRNPHRTGQSAEPNSASLAYAVPEPSHWWPLIRSTDTVEVHLYFWPDGRFHSSELHSDHSD